jgi:hypothetical protein
VVLVELVLLLGESIGVGWRWLLLLVHAVVIVELVLLRVEWWRASALVGDGDCCWCMQWYSSSWCFSSGRASALWCNETEEG